MATTITGSGVDNIIDGTITNADINASAGIDAGKLSGAGKVLQRKSTSTFNSSAWTLPSSVTDYLTLSMTAVSSTSKYIIEVHSGAVWFTSTAKDALFEVKKDGSYIGSQVSGYGLGYLHANTANAVIPVAQRLVVASGSGDYVLRLRGHASGSGVKFYTKSETVYSITEVEV
jgi:hypothetical protein